MTSEPQYVFVPHAGGSASDLLDIAKLLCPADQRHLMELPGRGRRRRDPLVYDADAAIDDLEAQLAARFAKAQVSPDVPVLFFGHSFGGYLAWILAGRHQRRNPGSAVLVVALSNEPPHMRRNFHSALSSDVSEQASTSQLLHFITELGGVPDSIRDTPELLERFYPLLIADLSVADSLPRALDQLRDTLPLVLAHGKDDPITENWAAWADLTTGPHVRLVLPGGHFVVFDSSSALAQAIRSSELYHDWIGAVGSG
jgi:surfactin synthase thioesterase subunit